MKSRVFGLILLLVGSAQAAETRTSAFRPYKGFFGAQLGTSSVNASGVGTGFGFALDGGYYFPSNFGAGVFLRSSTHGNDVTSFFLGAQGLYRLTQITPGLTGGIMLGSGKFARFQTAGTSAFSYGVKLGYEYSLKSEPITVGLDASLNWLKPGTELLTVFSPMATVRYTVGG